jgi:hypothetical protein
VVTFLIFCIAAILFFILDELCCVKKELMRIAEALERKP